MNRNISSSVKTSKGSRSSQGREEKNAFERRALRAQSEPIRLAINQTRPPTSHKPGRIELNSVSLVDEEPDYKKPIIKGENNLKDLALLSVEITKKVSNGIIFIGFMFVATLAIAGAFVVGTYQYLTQKARTG